MQDPLLGGSSPPRKTKKVAHMCASELTLLRSFENQGPDESGQETASDPSEGSLDSFDPLGPRDPLPPRSVNKAFSTVEEQDILLKALDDAAENEETSPILESFLCLC